MFVKPEGPLEDIKTVVFHHQVKAKYLNFSTYIYIFLLSIKYLSFSSKNLLLIFRIFDIKADLLEFRNSPNAKFSSLILMSWLYATGVSNHE